MSSASKPKPQRSVTLATFLPYRLNVLATVVSGGLGRIYGERFGIGIPEWRVLATIGEFKRITAKAIGQHSEMGKVKISRAAASLEERGFIQREANADDLREMFLTLTPAGQSVYDEIVPLALNYAAQLTADLSPDEEATFGMLLDRLLARARKEFDGSEL
ncbi:MarR family winged helix-turn-helix transcriptional regulator [Methylorubrum thiocyanatum]|uniref:DNA-binding MarR family transcriptional regulator n=1 Tax=Methylorubrum thiocyanatum TaxID=47958 RepID=A0AA40S3U2_9HYPH|nr:MarR family transcriptional regulator [Methylorubrum thiocyanatum]MBA8914075.1 DNA-binding MarR family transcriptional regulator [Methylorubrum thiocyanatum]GJE79041.1 Multidrug resistance operon repressor [Methylorubrum thiocyanatum]